MGKSRRARGHAARKDPIAKTVKPPSDPELAALRESKILPVINDLKSADPKSRSAAASAISNIIQDEKCRKLLLREQIVHTITTQTLTDAALESRAAGWGILRILAQEEEPDFCVHLYRVDILTAIEFAAKSITEMLLSKDLEFQKRSKPEQATILSIASSLISLLTALAEAQDDILEAISRNTTITRFLLLLTSDELASSPDIVSLRSDALACLMILCEDNEELSDKVVNSKEYRTYGTLLSLRKTANSDGVLACGVLHNLFSSLDGQDIALGADNSLLIPTLSQALKTFEPGQMTDAVGWANPVEYQQLALEILASIGTTLNTSAEAEPQKEEKPEVKDDEEMGDADEEISDGEEGGEEDDDEMDDDELEADMEMVTGADRNEEDSNIDDLPILKTLIDNALPELIRHALSALNNIAWSVSLIDFSDLHNAPIQNAWDPVGRALWTQVIAPILATDTADIDLATHVTSLAWGPNTPFADEHCRFIALYQATKGSPAAQNLEDPFQSLSVKCIGVLGQLALDPAPIDRNHDIGTFLITLLASLPETPTADAVEALNQVFDIYADESYSYDKEVFWNNNFLKHLDETVPKVRTMIKSIDKRANSELRLRADEAVLNLNRFLTYKRKNKPQA
ncbi:Armadillo-like helical [Fusarium oxysporum f. sp. vasinfectum]|nr:Armadillo-like helical [Fusarium oxysporum f. sp. vasinfectum]